MEHDLLTLLPENFIKNYDFYFLCSQSLFMAQILGQYFESH